LAPDIHEVSFKKLAEKEPKCIAVQPLDTMDFLASAVCGGGRYGALTL